MKKSCAKNFCRKLLRDLMRKKIQKFSVEWIFLKVAGTEHEEKKISVAPDDEYEYRLYGDTGI